MASSLTSFLTVSNNLINNHKATTGNVITLTAIFDTPAAVITGTLNTNPLTYVQQGITSTYIASYTVLESDPQGDIVLELDADTVSATATTDATPVEIDTLPPTGTITYVTSGSSLIRPKVGETHTLTLDLTEELLTYPKLSFGTVSRSRVDNKIRTSAPQYKWVQGSTLQWTATYTITGNELLPRSLLITLVDLAGNTRTITYRIVETKVLDFLNKFYYFDHFFNKTQGKYYTSGGGTTTIVSPIELGECGILRLNVDAVDSYAGYNISENYITFLYQTYNYFEATLKISDLSDFDVTEDSIVRFGFVDSDATNPTDGIYFESDTTNNRWNCVTAENGSYTNNSVLSPINVLKTPSLWSKILKIIYSGTQVKFYIDGYLIDTQTYSLTDPIGTSSFPSLGFYIRKVNGSSTHFFKADAIELYMKNLSVGDFNDDYSGDFFI